MVPFSHRVRTIKMCPLNARGEGPIQATLLKNGGGEREKVGRDIRRADDCIDCGFVVHPGVWNRTIEQVLDVQVDLLSTKLFKRPCYAARSLTVSC